MALLLDLIRNGLTAHPAVSAEAVPAVAAASPTVVALKAARDAFGDSRVGVALGDLLTGHFAGWSDAEPLGEAALAIIAAALPAEAVPLALAAICWKNAPEIVALIERVRIAPGAPGEGQTQMTPHMGRRA